jgi:hypothetical protein
MSVATLLVSTASWNRVCACYDAYIHSALSRFPLSYLMCFAGIKVNTFVLFLLFTHTNYSVPPLWSYP